MTEPLSDEVLHNCEAHANYLDMGRHPGDRAMAGTIRALLAEVARLKAELAESNRIRDAYKRAKTENDDRFMAERDEARDEVASLRAENATIREDNARLTAALEAQGQATFVAGMRAKDDIEELAREIEEFAWNYFLAEKPDTETVRTVVREMLESALKGEDTT